MNTSHLGQPSLTRNIKSICSFYSDPLNRQLNWWDTLKLDIQRACHNHGRAESARVKGQIRALQTKVAALSTNLLEQPHNQQTLLDLAQAEHQLSNYLNKKLSFIRNFASMKLNPHSSNTLQLLANKIRTRKAKTFISSLTSDGSTVSSHDEIHQHAATFYKNLYSHSNDRQPNHPIWKTYRTILPPDI